MTRPHIVLCLAFFLLVRSSFGQGRIVINEFMPWSGCSTTSEFIELMNFGPGPMDIGCYTVTNGTYAVTIPANTILQPRQYFLISGQDVLNKACGNEDSAVRVDLNWTTCNCSNVPIPATGDGFMQNGGSANEKIVLLDPSLNVIDAVARKLPVSSSQTITTSSTSSCGSKTFNLANMGVSYETIDNSTGIDNSFARKVDGDCGWVKTTSISARAPNKTGSTSSASYDFSTLSASECDGTGGSISINVSATDVNALFPMNYTLGFDADSNDLFEASDLYTYGVDNSAPSIDIDHLAYGRYRITVGSSSSCNLKSFDFFVFNCYGIVLPVKLLYFTYEGSRNQQHVFRFKIDDASTLNNVVLEGNDGNGFVPVSTQYAPFASNMLSLAAPVAAYRNFRLRLTSYSGAVSYSQEIKVPVVNTAVQFWPNPVQSKLFVKLNITHRTSLICKIVNANGAVVKREAVQADTGMQTLSLSTEAIPAGLYYCVMEGEGLSEAVHFRFVKQ